MTMPSLQTRRATAVVPALLILILVLFCSSFTTYCHAKLLPDGFVQTLIPGLGLEPVGMRAAADGRLLVLEHEDTGPSTGYGTIRVVENGVALPQPMLSIAVERGGGMEGLHDVAFHPNFALTDPYLYVSYTASAPEPHNRISRWLIDGNLAVNATDEEIIFELPAYPGDTDTHFGGAIVFGNDEKLYFTVGDHQDPTLVQRMDSLMGKVLRLNDDGSVPDDNPYIDELSGPYRLIFAAGLRNPWKMAHDPVTDKIYFNDVGSSKWEEVNELVGGGNFGWPNVEGPGGGAEYVDPVTSFSHELSTPFACAIAGGTFYRPGNVTNNTFPPEYVGKYFVSDFCNSWIYVVDDDNKAGKSLVKAFSDETSALPADRCGSCGQIIDLAVTPGGNLWQLRRIRVDGTETRLFRTEYIASGLPYIGTHPTNIWSVANKTGSFHAVAFGQGPMTYQWQRNSVDIVDAAEDTLVLKASAIDNGAKYRVIASNALGNVASDEATLVILPGRDPEGSILSPPPNTTYAGGDVIYFEGVGTDADDGVLPASQFSWSVEFVHDDHTHPFITALQGTKSGSFQVPEIGETETTVKFRIWLTIADFVGAQTSYFIDVLPRTHLMTFQTIIAVDGQLFETPGLEIAVDGQPDLSPFTSLAVEGVYRFLTAPLLQRQGQDLLVFASWSHGEASSDSIPGPDADTTYTATYQISPPAPPATASELTINGYINFTGGTGEIAWVDIFPEIFASPGTIELIFNAALESWKPSSTQAIFGSSKGVLQLLLLKSGRLKLVVKIKNDKAVKARSTKLKLSPRERIWLRVTYDSIAGEVAFFSSKTETVSSPISVADWVQVGTTKQVSSGVMKSTQTLIVGRQKPGERFPLVGRLFAAGMYTNASSSGPDITSGSTNENEDASSLRDGTRWDSWNLSENLQYLEAEASMLSEGFVWFGGMSGDRAEVEVNNDDETFGIIDARIRVSMHNWTPDFPQAVLGSNPNTFKLEIADSGKLKLKVKSRSGSVSATSSSTPSVPPYGTLWLRFTFDEGSGLTTFYTSQDKTSDPVDIMAWEQLGLQVDGVADRIEPGLNTFVLGGGNVVAGSSGFRPMMGKVYGGALLKDSTVLASVDFSDIGALTSSLPDYSRWGEWSLICSICEYVSSVDPTPYVPSTTPSTSSPTDSVKIPSSLPSTSSSLERTAPPTNTVKVPSSLPSKYSSQPPSSVPTRESLEPSTALSQLPSIQPSGEGSDYPVSSTGPSKDLTETPTGSPSLEPSKLSSPPSTAPTSDPSEPITYEPSSQQSVSLSSQPSDRETAIPASGVSLAPSPTMASNTSA